MRQQANKIKLLSLDSGTLQKTSQERSLECVLFATLLGSCLLLNSSFCYRRGAGSSAKKVYNSSTTRGCRLSAKSKPVDYGFNLSFGPKTGAVDAGERLKQVFDWSGKIARRFYKEGGARCDACTRMRARPNCICPLGHCYEYYYYY